MHFKTLVELFHNHATYLINDPDPSAKFRARNYSRVGGILEEQFDGKEQVTKAKIDSLDITDFMKKKAYDVASGADKFKTSTRSKSVGKQVGKNSTQLQTSLSSLMGIGNDRAKKLIAQGLTDISQLKQKKWLDKLPLETRSFLKLKPIRPIPHEAIEKIEPILKRLQTTNLKLHIVGSYRREKKTSNDIDIMIVSDADDAIDKFFLTLGKRWKSILPYSKGVDKMSVIIDVSDVFGKGKIAYKFDIFRVKKENILQNRIKNKI